MRKMHKSQGHGIKLMLVGSIILPMMDAASKSMGETISASTIVLARFFFQSLFLLPFVWRTLYIPQGTELALHFKRSATLSIATLCFFTAIQKMPIADALAIFFTMPLIVTLLAPWALGEKVGMRRIIAVAVGLIGALIIIQPGQAIFGLHAFLPLGTALGFAFYLIYTRKLARNGKDGDVDALSMQFWSGLIGVFVTSLAILLLQPLSWSVFEVTWPEVWQWQRLVLVGLFAAVGHLLITKAFKYADASLLAPFQYVELISAAVLGWWLFDDIPTPATISGTLILVASGLYLIQRNHRI